MKVLLDTNAYVALKRGVPEVVRRVRQSRRVLISAVVVGELLYGFRNGSRYKRNLRELRDFMECPRVELVPITWTTCERYGRVFAALRRKGKPIPTNDVWIAAHALETGADLLSFDDHFAHVDGVAWEKPVS